MRAVVLASLLLTGCERLFPLESSDGGVDGDVTVDGTGDGGPPIEHNLAFVTSRGVPGDFGGLAAADAICQAAARDNGLPANTYVAWLSDQGTDAIDRLAGARGWTRSDGQPVADLASSLGSVGPLVPIALDEGGFNVISSIPNVWTGTNALGVKHPNRCGEWLQPGAVAASGLLNRGGPEFTESQSLSCGNSFRLYCLGTERNHPLTLPARDASTFYLFVSSNTWNANDPDVADQLCATEAGQVALPGSYRAVVIRQGQSLSDLGFDTLKVYTRIDGVVLGTVLSGDSIAVPLLTATKQVISSGAVWTGGLGTGTAMTTCDNWAGTGSGVIGLPYTVGVTSFSFNTVNCAQSAPARVYCARYQ